MRICFVSNYLIHHQLPFCLKMVDITNNNFVFIETSQLPKERINLGYSEIGHKYDFVQRYFENPKKSQIIINESDVVIFGDSKKFLIKKRLRYGKMTFRYSERFFKKTNFDLFRFIKYYFYYGLNDKRNIFYLLCGRYAKEDYEAIGCSASKMFKWGYFPPHLEYDIRELLQKKEKNTILWAGRLIDYKHPEFAIYLANDLRNKNLLFHTTIIGDGPLKKKLEYLVMAYNLEAFVTIRGSTTPELLRKMMEQSEYFILTSDREEGWGAVLNEAMNSGCLVVSSNRIGSATFMLDNCVNGFVFQEGFNDFRDAFMKAFYADNKAEVMTAAYRTIINLWNGEIAAERLFELIKDLNSNRGTKYGEGPCSKA